MKQIIKILTVTLSIVLILCVLMIAVNANDSVSAVSSGTPGFEYVDSNGDTQNTEDLKTALNEAKQVGGSCIVTMTGDTEFLAAGTAESVFVVSSANGELIIDLNGYTLTIVQGGMDTSAGRREIRLSSNSTLTVRNGTISVNRIDSENKNNSHPLFVFRDNHSGAVLNLENVNTYSGSLIYANKAVNATVNIKGGEHHTTLGYNANEINGGFVNSRTSMSFTAQNATFFTDKSSFVVASLSANTTEKSSFTFEGCTLISDPKDSDGTNTLVKYANDKTTLTFNDCLIYGSINPTVESEDKNSSAIPAANIVFGKGTCFSGDMSLAGYKVSGTELNKIAYTKSVTVVGCNDDVENGFILSELTTDCVLTHGVDVYTVAWYDKDRNPIALNLEDRGAAATPPEYAVPENILNGWVDIAFDGGWSESLYGEAVNDLTVSKNIVYYPSAGTKRSYMKDSQYNLSLFGNVATNLYIPTTENPEGIDFISVKDSSGTEIVTLEKQVLYNNRIYNAYRCGYVGATELDTATVVTVDFTFNSVPFTQTITMRPTTYVKSIFSKEDESYGVAKTLVADMVIYSNTLWQFAKETDENNSVLLELLTEAEKYKTNLDVEYPSTSFTEGTLGDYEALRTYVDSLTFNVSEYEPRYLVKMNSGTRVTKIEFIINDSIVYGIDEEKSEFTEETLNDKEYEFISTATSDRMSIYYIDTVVKIRLTVLGENGEEITVSGTYTLNDYYKGVYDIVLEESSDKAERFDKLLRSLRAYGRSAKKYRFGE